MGYVHVIFSLDASLSQSSPGWIRHRIYDWPSLWGGSARLPRLAKVLLNSSQLHLIFILDYREKVGQLLSYEEGLLWHLLLQDGYTMETLDIHGVNIDGNDTVIIRNVSVFMIYPHSSQWQSSLSLFNRHMYVISSLYLHPGRMNDDHITNLRSVTLGVMTTPLSVSRNPLSLPSVTLNPHLPVGSEPLDVLGYRIWQSVGPSGPNKVCWNPHQKYWLNYTGGFPYRRITFSNSQTLSANSRPIRMILISSPSRWVFIVLHRLIPTPLISQTIVRELDHINSDTKKWYAANKAFIGVDGEDGE